jgi:restriction system protein
LHRRLANLIERGFVNREGNIYTITQAGINYATPLSKIATDPGRNVLKTINTYNQKQRKALHQQLAEMSPYQFEHLIRDLLEAMGYEAVTVTKEAGDKGVDVVGTVQFGITTITEVVQVKRHRANIGRPVLDQLRGALPYHKAIRGTLITLGNFSKGCKEAALFPGAAPITLINGEKLLDLLIEHEIGLRKRPVQLYELDEDLFRADDEAAIVE